MLFTHKKNKMLVHPTPLMNLENTMLSKINWTKKVKYCTISFLCGTKISPMKRQKINDCQGLEAGENGDLLLSGYRGSDWEDQKFLEMDGGGSCTLSMYLMLLNRRLKNG